MTSGFSFRLPLIGLSLVALLGACDGTSVNPDYRVKLVPSADGKQTLAIPPECPSWRDVKSGPQANEPWPQYGCAQARNLAAQVERPEDLATPRALGQADGVVTANSIQNYRTGKTKALIDAKAEAPAAQAPTNTQPTP